MDPLLIALAGLAIGLALGAVLGLLIARLRQSTRGTDPRTLQSQHDIALAQVRASEFEARAKLESELSAIGATANALREQVAGLKEQHTELLERQRTEHEAQKERERAESKVLQMPTPVQKNLRAMQLKVTDLETQRQK